MAIRLTLAYTDRQLSFDSRQQQVIKLGRHHRAHVQLADASVSRVHACIELTCRGATVVDLGTLTGTRVAGQTVRGRRPLNHRDIITLGGTELHVKLEPILELPIAVPRRDTPIPAPPAADPTLVDHTVPCLRGVGRNWLARDYVTSEKYDTRALVAQLRNGRRTMRAAVTMGVLGVGLLVAAVPAAFEHEAPIPEVEVAEIFSHPSQPPPESPPPAAHVVLPGDTLGTIAANRLGDHRAWETIWQVNRDRLEDPSKLEVGMVLVLPELP